MVRLIRLASVDDCNFRTAFGNDIKIEPGSKIAVLNATFETRVSEISINNRNNEIKFTPSVAGGVVFNDTSTFLPIRTYSGELGITQFWQDMGQTLSNTLGYRDTLSDTTMNPGGAKINAGVFSEFEMQYNEYNQEFPIPRTPVEFVYTYSPMLSALGTTWSMNWPQGSRNSALLEDKAANFGDADQRFNWSGDGDATPDFKFANTLKLTDAQLTANVGTKVRMDGLPGVVMSKGNGLWMARVSFLADNASGLQDNGFGIGLSRELGFNAIDLDIPADMIHGEIRVNRPGEGYRFRFNGGDEQTSLLTPRRYDGNDPLTDHDIIWLRVGKDESSPTGSPTYGKYCLQGGVWQDAGAAGLETVLFTYELKNYFNQYDFLTPYLFINGTSDTCEMDAIAFTPSVTHAMQTIGVSNPNQLWLPDDPNEFDMSFGNREYKITNILKTGNGNAYPPSVIGNIVPQVDEERFNASGAFTRETKLSLHSDVLKYLGFGNIFTGYETISQKMGMANLEFDNFITYRGIGGPDLDHDDNFIVESLTLPVDSYDASEQYYGDGDPFKDVGLTDSAERLGRRKNIIATIPATNVSELVNYEASTPQYIDLRNTSTLNERNLEFRIVDKDFNPVETGNKKSILTLLISGPGER